MTQIDSTKIIELLFIGLPTLILAYVFYNFFNFYIKNEQHKRHHLLANESKPDTLSIRLQAYERMTLFLERINPSQLLVRISPISQEKMDYLNFVIAQIEQEFEHNLAQQIYISDECWLAITTAKNSTIQLILLAAQKEFINDANQLREEILKDLLEKAAPSNRALSLMKDEIRQLY